jgi:hypothetical protein
VKLIPQLHDASIALDLPRTFFEEIYMLDTKDNDVGTGNYQHITQFFSIRLLPGVCIGPERKERLAAKLVDELFCSIQRHNSILSLETHNFVLLASGRVSHRFPILTAHWVPRTFAGLRKCAFQPGSDARSEPFRHGAFGFNGAPLLVLEHKVLRSYLQALPIPAKTGREWEPENACSFTETQDDEFK